HETCGKGSRSRLSRNYTPEPVGATRCHRPGPGNRCADQEADTGADMNHAPNQLGIASDPLTIARGYLRRGWNPILVSRRTKSPFEKDWQKRRLTEETVAAAFNGGDMNIGVQMGPMSNGLTDIDLDCREAVMIGPMLLPPSNNVFG